MKRRQYIATTGAAAFGASMAGCLNGNPNSDRPDEAPDPPVPEDDDETGTLSTAVSDGPSAIDDFESLVVSVEEIRLFPKGQDDSDDDSTNGADDGEGDEPDTDPDSDESTDDPAADDGANGGEDSEPDAGAEDGDETGDASDEGESDADDEGDESEGGPMTIPVDGAEVDLVNVQGEAKSLINESDVPTGEYSHLQLDISNDISATLVDAADDAEPPTVTKPGNAPLQFNKPFEVRADERTMFIADFAPFNGGPEDYMLRPVPDKIRVLYGDDADDSVDGAENSDSDGTEGAAGNSGDESSE